ncbi:MAG: UV DNA damage repair endonuclease UvsE [Syntrophomonadaceae bacterium]
MIIRFGYVAMSAILEDCSPSQTITFKNLSKITSAEGKHSKLFTLAKRNLQNIQRLFFHNQAHDIKVFRLTSKLVPLATHPDTQEWNWAMELKQEFKKLGKYAREHGFRLSAHPDHFTLLNSPRDEILAASIKDLEYHRQIFAGMEMDASSKLVIHVGGCYKNKADSLKRFKRNYLELPGHLKERIVLENDDKIFTARDVLDICTDVGIPMVLDIHHHWCNNYADNIEDYLPAIFATWQKETCPPKIHLSSPKDTKHFRHHADYIDSAFFLDFLTRAKTVDQDLDVMIEAKLKDKALFHLMQELRETPGIKIINQASIAI